MAKMKDITEKLSFDGNPFLMVKEEKLEVCADAPTMIKIMGLVGQGDPGPKEMMEAMDLVFTDEAKEKIAGLKLNFQDLMVVIQEGIGLITGQEEEAPGEQ